MTSEQRQVRNWMVQFGQACPNGPTIPGEEVVDLRAKIELEETLELLIDGLGIFCVQGKNGDKFNLTLLKDALKSGALFHKYKTPDIKEVADACSDKSVVNYGTMAAFGILDPGCVRNDKGEIVHFGPDIDPLFNEVMESNWSKMWTHEEVVSSTQAGLTYKCTKLEYGPKEKVWLVTDTNGKVIKSPSYNPANLQPIIDSFKS